MRYRAFPASLILVPLALPACDSPSVPEARTGHVIPDPPPTASVSVTPRVALAEGLRAPEALLQDLHIPVGFEVAPLARSGFLDDLDTTFRLKLDGRATRVTQVRDPSDMIVARLTLDPGGSVGWHTHPGPALVAVRAGAIGIINAFDCVLRIYPAGSAFLDPGQGNVHVGFNATEGVTEAYVTFIGIPPGEGPTIPLPAGTPLPC